MQKGFRIHRVRAQVSQDLYLEAKCGGSYQKLALYWAPINYQYVSLKGDDYQTKKDLLCPVNFECYSASQQGQEECWNTHVVRRRLGQADFASLTPAAYYSVAVTDSHYFVLYAYYHADDDTHPSDLEGCMLVLERGDADPRLLGMVTVAHQDFVPYAYAGRMTVKSRPAWQHHFQMEVEEEVEGDHALIQQAQGKHGLYALTPHIGWGEKLVRRLREVFGMPEDVIVYFPGEMANTYSRDRLYRGRGTPHNPTFYYELVDILDPEDGLYGRYLDAKSSGGNETFRENGSFHNDETVGNANGPWLWKPGLTVGGPVAGDMWEDPVALAASIFETKGRPFSANYSKRMHERS